MQVSERAVEDLVRTARVGDPRAWAELVRRYDGMVRATAGTFRMSDADAADAVQNTWLSAVEELGALRRPERFGGWLRTIAHNECRTLWTRVRREMPCEHVAEHLADPRPGPEATALRIDARRAVRATVGTLTGHSRAVIEFLYYRPGADYAQAARAVGMSPGSIGPTRARALVLLRHRLERRGTTGAAAG